MAIVPNAYILFPHSLDPKLFFYLPMTEEGCGGNENNLKKCKSSEMVAGYFQKKKKKGEIFQLK